MPGKAFYVYALHGPLPQAQPGHVTCPPGSSLVLGQLGPGEGHVPGACPYVDLSVPLGTSVFKVGGGVVISVSDGT